MSRQENTGMSLLDNYAKSGRPQEYQWASGSLNNAFTGNYKPIVDPKAADGMYDAIKKRVLTIELPEIQNSVAKNANLSGMYHSGGHSKQQAQEAGNVATRLAETLAKLRYQDEQDRRSVVRERERRSFDAIPQAVTVGQAINQDPLNKAVASVQYGSLPRSLQQAELDADFSEYQRTQPENNPAIAQALSYLARQGYQQTDYSRSGFKMDPNLPAYLYDATYKYQNPPPPATTP
ncbi:MAG: hypothetical protein HGJ93_00720 [Desulfosarcina sp.]|nr:hypothetical protein [Desulfosarcina sp.]MBC2764509.1 hypothetical protein [Desulfosarcina sp.]